MSAIVTALRAPRGGVMPSTCLERAKLRAWLEFVVETGIELLDAMDSETEDLEDDEREFVVMCD